jgi:hypothetical protein
MKTLGWLTVLGGGLIAIAGVFVLVIHAVVCLAPRSSIVPRSVGSERFALV